MTEEESLWDNAPVTNRELELVRQNLVQHMDEIVELLSDIKMLTRNTGGK